MGPPDPLGRAMPDRWRGEYEPGDLVYVDGERTQRGSVGGHYFEDPIEPDELARRRDAFVEGPVLDGAVGRDGTPSGSRGPSRRSPLP